MRYRQIGKSKLLHRRIKLTLGLLVFRSRALLNSRSATGSFINLTQ